MVATLILGFAYWLLGVETQVLAICSGAPNWWGTTYWYLGLAIPAAAVLCGWLGYHGWRFGFGKKRNSGPNQPPDQISAGNAPGDSGGR